MKTGAKAVFTLATCITSSGVMAAGVGFEEIVVTAQKREQVAQNIPISLFAAPGFVLERSGFQGVEDLSDMVAGVQIVGGNPGKLQISMRGVTNLTASVQSTAATGYYVDETPLSALATEMPEVALWDIERVEVLRGPQGTLFGEGSMGGTIRVITKKPDPSVFAGQVRLAASTVKGGEEGADARAMLNLPVIADKLAVRFTAGYEDIAGWTDVPDLGQKDANDGEQKDLRVAARWQASENLLLDLTYMYHDLNVGEFGETSPGALNPREIIPFAGAVGFITTHDTRYHLANLTATYDVGGASIVSTSSYFDQDGDIHKELDSQMPLFFGVPGTGFVDGPTKVKVFTQELRAGSTGNNRLDWTVGLYYKNDKRISSTDWHFDIPLFGLNEVAITEDESSADSYAIFADADYQLTDQVSIQIGGRYYWDDREFVNTAVTDSIVFGVVGGTVTTASDSASTFSPKVSLSWTPAEDILVFAKVSKGFRSGGANALPSGAYPTAPSGYAPETLWAYEVGLKTTPMEDVVINVYGYYNDWTDLQLGFLTPDGLYGYTDNAGKARALGGEVEIVAQPAEGLTLGINTSYTDAEIREDVFNVFGGLVAAKGNRVPFASKFKLALSANYEFPLTDTVDGVVHATYSHFSPNFSEPENRLDERNGTYNQVYVKAGVKTGSWGAYLFADNLFDRADTTFRQRPITLIPLVYNTYVRPRTIGLELKADF